MISKTQLKTLSSYKHQKFCDQDGLFVVEGVKMVDEVLTAKLTVRSLCATAEWMATHPTANAIEVSEEELARLSGLKAPNQVWALCERNFTPHTEGSSPLILALDHLQDPGNLGTIIRTADWFGIRTIICSTDTVSCFNPKVVQSTMGGLFRTQIIYTDLEAWLRSCQRPICGALLDGDNVYTTPLPQNAVLVIGNESKGISQPIRQLVTHKLLIPNIGGTCESLNAGIATGILVSEFARSKQ